ncbi:MAG TPA: hypothetical protein VFT81_05075 [Dermatophilaceae bacterium]|nr:hypothetical protein [Dermatophilaceae bacterium]
MTSSRPMTGLLTVQEVRVAVAVGRVVIALESAVLAHRLPHRDTSQITGIGRLG